MTLFPSYLALYISSIWLPLSCTLSNEPAGLVQCSPESCDLFYDSELLN